MQIVFKTALFSPESERNDQHSDRHAYLKALSVLSACSNSPDCFRKEMVITEGKAQMKLSVYYST